MILAVLIISIKRYGTQGLHMNSPYRYVSPISMSFGLTLFHILITIHYKFIMIKCCDTNFNNLENLSIHWPNMYKSVLIKAILFRKVPTLCHLVKVRREYCNCSNFVITTALGTQDHRIVWGKTLEHQSMLIFRNLIALRLNPS